jgi:four helix bundle protein
MVDGWSFVDWSPGRRAAMSRDHRKLRVFQKADEAVIRVYRATQQFPVEERSGLQGQLRKAAVSTPTNIVEGCARRSTADDLRFLDVAAGSAAEARYLLGLSRRLGDIDTEESELLISDYTEIPGGLQNLIASLCHEL